MNTNNIGIEADGDVRKSAKLKGMVWDKSKGHCWYCGKKMNPFLEFSIDHKIPNKDDSLDNLVPCCRLCNSIKGNRSIQDFRDSMTYKQCIFTTKQTDWLKTRDINLDFIRSSNPYIFYFEEYATYNIDEADYE